MPELVEKITDFLMETEGAHREEECPSIYSLSLVVEALGGVAHRHKRCPRCLAGDYCDDIIEIAEALEIVNPGEYR